MTNLQTKVCCLCKLEKELSNFYKDKYNPDGLTYKCKLCSKELKRFNTHHNHNTAKAGALIAADEILKLPELDNNDMKGWNYWQEVKEEIEKL